MCGRGGTWPWPSCHQCPLGLQGPQQIFADVTHPTSVLVAFLWHSLFLCLLWPTLATDSMFSCGPWGPTSAIESLLAHPRLDGSSIGGHTNECPSLMLISQGDLDMLSRVGSVSPTLKSGWVFVTALTNRMWHCSAFETRSQKMIQSGISKMAEWGSFSCCCCYPRILRKSLPNH